MAADVTSPDDQEPASRRAAHDRDAELLARAAAGDDRAFAEVYEAHRKRLYRLAYGIVLDAGEAREAVQEAFLRLHRAAPTWEPRAAVGTWLYRVVLNHCLGLKQRLRRLARPFFAPAPTLSPERAATHSQTMRIVERSLASLPERQRAVATLFLEAELQPSEIAPLVDMTPNAARVTLHRALAKLRAELSEAGIDALPSADEHMIDSLERKDEN